MAEKEFKNLSEQIEIMKSKGLTIDDEEKAKVVLLRENYFFLVVSKRIFAFTAGPSLYSESSPIAKKLFS